MAEVKPGKGFAAVSTLSALTAGRTGVAPPDACNRPGTAVLTLASVRGARRLSPNAGTPVRLGEQGCRLLWTRTAGISALSVQVTAGVATFRSRPTDTCRVTGTGPQEHGTGWGWRYG
jgi:hypothetical protein